MIAVDVSRQGLIQPIMDKKFIGNEYERMCRNKTFDEGNAPSEFIIIGITILRILREWQL